MRAMIATLALANVLSLPLPSPAPVVMDYLAYDSVEHRLWVPAGNSGNVDVIDTRTKKLTPLTGFPTAPSPRAGRPPVGPSSATVGDSTVFAGNRADHALCALDRKTLQKGACVTLPSMPDGIAWVAATREVWATTPRDSTLTITDGKKVTGTLKLAGEPEGYLVDGATFYTNLEDKDRTLAIDVKTRKVIADWPAGCGGDGPRGLALDAARHFLIVACADGASVLDLAHGGKQLGRLKTGGGVDNIDYRAGTLYVASGKDGQLTRAKIGDNGAPQVTSTVPTAPGARCVVADESGTAWVADSQGGRILVISP
jgi:DNA-binding beta-propeller fold protein YncE